MISWFKLRAGARHSDVSQASRPLDFQALEPRFMFDGAVAATVADATPHDTSSAAHASSDAAKTTTDASADKTAAATSDARTNTDGASTPAKEVAFVDTSVSNYQQLVSALRSNVEVVLLDASQDGLQQIAGWASTHEGYSAIHIISHGGEGTLQIGDTLINATTLQQSAQSALVAEIGKALTRDGDILLYGCDVAEGSDGTAFVDQFAQLSGADVEASTNATGGLARGGDWNLEYASGEVTAHSALDLAAADAADVLLALPANGVKDVTQTMSTGSNFVPGFTLAANGPLGTDDPSGLYLNIQDDTAVGVFSVAADGTNLASFDLTGITFVKFANFGNFTFTVTGYKINGSTVSTTFTSADGSTSYTSGSYTNFTGLTSFSIQIQPDSSGLGYSVDQNTLDSFTIANATAPVTSHAPSLSATGGSRTYTEDGSAVSLFSGAAAATNDSGQTFSGLTLSVSDVTDGSAEVLTIDGTSISLVAGSGTLSGGGSYTVAINSGTATVTLAGLTRSDAQLATLINGISYKDSSQDPTVATRTVTLTRVTDSGSSNNLTNLSIASTVSVVAVNDAPTLSGTASNPTYTENGAAVALFTGVTVGTVESGQVITQLNLQVSNLSDGASEVLSIDGLNLALVNGNIGTTDNGWNVAVSVTSGTASINLARSGGATTTAVASLIAGLSYRNLSEAPSTSARVVTLTSIRDNGGTANGGTDSTSLALASTVSVVAVNDAPTISGSATLASTNEDTASAGLPIATLLSNLNYSDPDGAGAKGIAVIATSGSGAWQYSTDGSTWVNIGTVSSASSLLLASTSQLRYLPNGTNGETATLTLRGWDQSSGSASTAGSRFTANTTASGGTSAFSSAQAQASINVTSVNDAPVLTAQAPTLTTIDEDATQNSGQTVASFLGSSVSDVDTGALSGIALTATNSGNGTWQYSTDGGSSWSNVGTVSGTSALLLRATDSVRFVPDGISGTSASLSYRAWDQTGASAGAQGTKVDIAATGGSTAFSSVADTATLSVTDVNDAPTLGTSSGSAAFVGAGAGSTAVTVDSGLTLADIDNTTLSSATVSISGNLQAGDTLLFSNTSSTLYGNVTASYDAQTGVLSLTSASASATLAQFQNALRAVQFNNANASPGTATRTVSFTVSDGLASSAVAARTVTVSELSPDPVLNLGTSSATYTSTGASSASLVLVPSLTVSDDDSSTWASATVSIGSGLAAGDVLGYVPSAATGNIVGSYDANSGVLSLSSAGAIATLAQWQAALRSLTFSNSSDLPSTATRTLSFSASDGVNSSTVSTFSLSVDHVNSAPAITAPLALAATEDTAVYLRGISFADPDAASSSLSVTLSAPSGVLSVRSAANITITANNSATVVVQGTLADLNALFAADSVQYTPAANVNGDVVINLTLSDQGNTGTGGTKTSSASLTVQLAAVNDAPVLTPAQPTLPGIDEDALNNTGQTVASLLGSSVSDVDSGAVQGIALYAANAGNGSWQYSLDGGSTWLGLGTVSSSSALLLRSSDSVRFVPNGIDGTSASLSYRAWDQSGSIVGLQGSRANLSGAGVGDSPYSAQSDTATLTVNAVNDAPQVLASSGAVAFIGTGASAQAVIVDAGLLLSDVDNSTLASAALRISANFSLGDQLLFSNNPATMGNITASYAASSGVLQLSSAGATATLAQWQAALRSVSYQNTDSSLSTATRTVSLVVNDGSDNSIAVTRQINVDQVAPPPAISAPISLAGSEDTALTLNGIQFSYAGTSASVLQATLSVANGSLAAASGAGVTVVGSGSASLVLRGTLADLNSYLANGQARFNPVADANGSVALSINLSADNSPGSASAQVDLAIAAVNDGPVNRVPGAQSTTSGTALVFSTANGNALSVADVDVGSGQVTVSLRVDSGTLTLASTRGLTFAAGSGAGDASVTFSGSLAQVNAALQGLRYDPAAGFSGAATLQLSSSDNGGSGAGGALSADSRLAINIARVAVVGDPQFMLAPPLAPPLPGLDRGQPALSAAWALSEASPANLNLAGEPLLPLQRFDNGLPALGSVFLHGGGSAPSYLAQVFSLTDRTPSPGGSDGVPRLAFGESSIAAVFPRYGVSTQALQVFSANRWTTVGGDSGLSQAAPTLEQQLQQLHAIRQQAQDDLVQLLASLD